jgi:hypothetical protein
MVKKHKPIKAMTLLIAEGIVSFVRIDHTIFLKTYAERDLVQRIKYQHRKETKELGFNPRKVLNPNGLLR